MPAKNTPSPIFLKRHGKNKKVSSIMTQKKSSLMGDAAPDFLLKDTQGQGISLAHYKDKKIVVLVFNRGFA
jgi:peroxiredoxin